MDSPSDTEVETPRHQSIDEKSLQQEVGPPPDGGLVAWTQAIMGHLVAFNTWGFLTSFGLFQTYYETELLSTYSSSDIAWIGSVQLFLIMFISTFSGRALDAGYFRWVYIPGCFLLVLGVFMTSLCKTYWQLFLAQALCAGIGSGLMFVPALGLVATYFSTKKVFILAFFLTGAGSGGMVFPAIVGQLLYKIGFPWTVRILGFLMLALCLLTIALFRTRLPPRRSGPIIEWAAFKEPTYVIYIIGMWFEFFPLYFAFYYIGPFARNIIGLDYQKSLNLLITTNGIGILGRLGPAYIAGRWLGPVNTIIPSAVVSSILVFIWITIDSVQGTYAFAVVYGFFGSGVQGLWPGGLTSLTVDITKTGTRVGMGFSIASLALLLGPPIGGYLVTYDHGQYLYAQIWAGTCIIFGAFILVIARISKTGWKLLAKV